jgi:hypothetical protein
MDIYIFYPDSFTYHFYGNALCKYSKMEENDDTEINEGRRRATRKCWALTLKYPCQWKSSVETNDLFFVYLKNLVTSYHGVSVKYSHNIGQQ